MHPTENVGYDPDRFVAVGGHPVAACDHPPPIGLRTIEVQHRDASMAQLVETLRTYLHGTDDTSHECQMVAIEPELVVLSCGCARSTDAG